MSKPNVRVGDVVNFTDGHGTVRPAMLTEVNRDEYGNDSVTVFYTNREEHHEGVRFSADNEPYTWNVRQVYTPEG